MASISEPQPLVLYPHSISNQASAPSSNGSFGPVFIVLAVIAVVAILACIIGRLCARRFCKAKTTSHVEDDIDFAFEINFPARKPGAGAVGNGIMHKGGKGTHVGMKETPSMHAEAGWKKGRPMPPVILDIMKGGKCDSCEEAQHSKPGMRISGLLMIRRCS